MSNEKITIWVLRSASGGSDFPIVDSLESFKARMMDRKSATILAFPVRVEYRNKKLQFESGINFKDYENQVVSFILNIERKEKLAAL